MLHNENDYDYDYTMSDDRGIRKILKDLRCK